MRERKGKRERERVSLEGKSDRVGKGETENGNDGLWSEGEKC